MDFFSENAIAFNVPPHGRCEGFAVWKGAVEVLAQTDQFFHLLQHLAHLPRESSEILSQARYALRRLPVATPEIDVLCELILLRHNQDSTVKRIWGVRINAEEFQMYATEEVGTLDDPSRYGVPYTTDITITASGWHYLDGNAVEWLEQVAELFTMPPLIFKAPGSLATLELTLTDGITERETSTVLLASEGQA